MGECEKVYCTKCKMFLGIKRDGKGPWADECPAGNPGEKCPSMKMLLNNRPRRPFEGHGGVGAGHLSEGEADADSPWYENRVRAYEGDA